MHERRPSQRLAQELAAAPEVAATGLPGSRVVSTLKTYRLRIFTRLVILPGFPKFPIGLGESLPALPILAPVRVGRSRGVDKLRASQVKDLHRGLSNTGCPKKGSGTKSAKHPEGRSGFWFLTPFSDPFSDQP